jgi:endonuclease/exonuclease/phosphatase family metal-dependent hydrolase
MSQLTVMTYNIENMRELFAEGAIRPDQASRALRLAEQIAAVGPDLLGIVEASDKPSHHEAFLALPPLASQGYRVLRGEHGRGKQDLVIYYKPAFEPVRVDDAYGFYDDWIEDIDHDGIPEVCSFERRPLEVELKVAGTDATLRVVLVATKSKGVFNTLDFIGHQQRAIANRKRLLAQCKKLRQRADRLLDADPNAAFLMMGDFNDEPGQDNYERLIGESSIETVMGNVFEPERILHNALWHKARSGKGIWTATYPDMIVANLEQHRAWLDHILVSPGMLREDAAIRYVRNSGEVGEPSASTDGAKPISDHLPIYCRLEVG